MVTVRRGCGLELKRTRRIDGGYATNVFRERAPDGVARRTSAGPNFSGIVADRCQLGFAHAKGLVRELTREWLKSQHALT